MGWEKKLKSQRGLTTIMYTLLSIIVRDDSVSSEPPSLVRYTWHLMDIIVLVLETVILCKLNREIDKRPGEP